MVAEYNSTPDTDHVDQALDQATWSHVVQQHVGCLRECRLVNQQHVIGQVAIVGPHVALGYLQAQEHSSEVHRFPENSGLDKGLLAGSGAVL